MGALMPNSGLRTDSDRYSLIELEKRKVNVTVEKDSVCVVCFQGDREGVSVTPDWLTGCTNVAASDQKLAKSSHWLYGHAFLLTLAYPRRGTSEFIDY